MRHRPATTLGLVAVLIGCGSNGDEGPQPTDETTSSEPGTSSDGGDTMGTNADGDSTSSSGSSTGAPIDVPVCDFPATFEGSVEVCDPFETCTATVDPPGCGDHPDFRIVIDGDTGQGSIFAIGWDLLSVSTGASPLGGEVCCLPPDTNIEVLVTNGIAQYQLELSFSSAGAVTLLSFTVYEG